MPVKKKTIPNPYEVSNNSRLSNVSVTNRGILRLVQLKSFLSTNIFLIIKLLLSSTINYNNIFVYLHVKLIISGGSKGVVGRSPPTTSRGYVLENK